MIRMHSTRVSQLQLPFGRGNGVRRGFTLLELLIVVVIMGVVAAMIVPRLEPAMTSQLEAAGGIVLADLDYARQLAVMNQSSYEVAFSSDGTQYEITHSGSNSGLDNLPQSAFRRPTDPADKHIGRFTDFPQAGIELKYVGMRPGDSTNPDTLEFGPLGELTGGKDTSVWLRAADSRKLYYLPIQINAVTGLATIGDMTTTNPIEADADSGSSTPSL